MLALDRRAREWLADNAPHIVRPESSGTTLMFAYLGRRNIVSMLVGTTIALVGISLVLILALRSLRLGLTSLVPNLVPGALGFGIWGLAVGEVGVSLSVVTAMTLGIVVDDTVHFLSKYRRARRELGCAPPDAVRVAFRTVGRALFTTSVVLVAGFFVVSLSSFELNSGMGKLTALVIALALLADFFLLPPLLMKVEGGSGKGAASGSVAAFAGANLAVFGRAGVARRLIHPCPEKIAVTETERVSMKTLLASLAVAAVLAANAAHAGPFAPAPRVVAKYERDFIERSGAQTLEELLETGITRYFLTGGQSLLVLVNGRPYATTASDLDTLPLSAIERIELLSGDTLGTLGGSAVRGALNIVLRNDLDGVEVRAVARMPTRDGGDGWQGSAFWGGAIGEGRMTVGVDVLGREEIAARSREHSRSEWTEGGAFDETQNVSVGGNTVWIVDIEDDRLAGIRSVSLGECDPAKGYTGPLDNPPGPRVQPGDKGCGFAYGAIMWNTVRYDQQNAILNLEHPVGEEALLHVDANFTLGDGAFRYAPSVGSFVFRPNDDLLGAINRAAGTDFDSNEDLFVVAHRFAGHGNRDWRSDSREHDISARLTGRLTENLGYDVLVDAYRLDGSVEGNTFVHEGRIREEIRAGNYDLENPFSRAPEHVAAIRRSSLTEEQDFGGDYQGARLALEGDGFSIGGRRAAWTSGVRLARAESHDVTVFRARDGSTHDVSEVLGSGGASFSGERKAAAAFAETSLPLLENLDLRLAGRGDDYDDVGGTTSWRLGAEYRPTGLLTLRILLERGRAAALAARSPQLRGPGPSLYQLRPGGGSTAPLLHRAQLPAGDARHLGQPGPRSFGRRALCHRRRGSQAPLVRERRVVSALALGPPGAEQRRLGHAEPRPVRGRGPDELYPSHRRPDHHPRPLCERRRQRSHGLQHPVRRGVPHGLGGGRHARNVAAGHQHRASHLGRGAPGRHPRKRPSYRFPRPARGLERRLDRQLPLGLREPAALRVVRLLDRPRPGAGLVRTPRDRGRTVHDRGVQPHRREALGEHRQPQQRRWADGSGLGAHLLRHREHAVLKGEGADCVRTVIRAPPRQGECGSASSPFFALAVRSMPARRQTNKLTLPHFHG